RDEPGTARAAEQSREEIARVADAVQVLRDLEHAALVAELLLLLVGQACRLRRVHAVDVREQLEHIGGIRSAVRVLVLPGTVPRAVGEEEDVLAHARLLAIGRSTLPERWVMP